MQLLFDRLQLSEEERMFAVQEGDIVYDLVAKAYLELPEEAYATTRAVAASAALAYALIKIDLWGKKVDEDFPK